MLCKCCAQGFHYLVHMRTRDRFFSFGPVCPTTFPATPVYATSYLLACISGRSPGSIWIVAVCFSVCVRMFFIPISLQRLKTKCYKLQCTCNATTLKKKTCLSIILLMARFAHLNSSWGKPLQPCKIMLNLQEFQSYTWCVNAVPKAFITLCTCKQGVEFSVLSQFVHYFSGCLHV